MSPPKPAARQDNPFVGPRPLTSEDALYGRDREVDRLLDQLVAERIVLLYSPSGAGKTSLIQAGLVPRLREDGFTVLPLPPARVGLEPPPDTPLPPHNRYQLSVLLGLDRMLPAEQQRPAAELAEMSLKRYLQCWPGQGDEGQDLVLLFDQFEELCALDSTDLSAKAEFMTRLGSVLRDPSLWALVAMREEYVTMLDPYLARFPTRLSSTFRLDFLNQQAARMAIQQPVADLGQGVTFSDGAATRLVNDLRRVRVDRPDGSTRVLGPWIEPVQLQVVCRQLWEELPPGEKIITEENIANAGDIDRALSRYYEKQIRAVVAKTGIDEGDLRNWFNEKLITERGLRDQISRGPGKGDRNTERALELLIDAHIIRAERRRDVTWYELAHDRLIEPVQDRNKWWAYEHKGWLALEAEEWGRQGRPADASPSMAVESVESSSRRLTQHEPATGLRWVGTIAAGTWMSALIALVLILVWRFERHSPLETQRVGVLVPAAFAVWSLSFLPGWLFVRFLDIRVRTLWTEYVLNLHRLGWDHPRYLPKPPPYSPFYLEWSDDNGLLLAHQQNIYREKFEAYYGRSVSQIHERSKFKVRIETLYPVFVATATMALCWAVVLPDTRFITHPSGAWDVLKYGFLGSYAFVAGMLLRRFFQSDLRPRAYATAVVRIVLVLLIVAVLNQVVGGTSRAELAVAFLIGLFPLDSLRPLLRVTSKALRRVVQPVTLDYPLYQLDGFNLRYEARLNEEGVEDIHSLTTMNLIDAMLSTRIAPSRLVDWIDQAFLLIHLEPTDHDELKMLRREDQDAAGKNLVAERQAESGAQVRLKLRRLGIRTATDLLKAFSVEQGELPGAQPPRTFRLPEGLASPLPVDELPLLVAILEAEPGLVPVWNWQQRGLQQRRGQMRESVSPASRVVQRAADAYLGR